MFDSFLMPQQLQNPGSLVDEFNEFIVNIYKFVWCGHDRCDEFVEYWKWKTKIIDCVES